MQQRVDNGFESSEDAVPSALEAANHALELNSESPTAFVSLGIIHHLQQEGVVALKLPDNAVQLRPGYTDAFSKISWDVPDPSLLSALRWVQVSVEKSQFIHRAMI